MPADSVNALFVYGTLRSDFAGPFAKRLQTFCGAPVAGRVQGKIFDLGEYPGLVESDHAGDIVFGEVYRLPPSSEALLQELDEYEDVPGGLYARRVFSAQLAGGELISVYAYVYLMQPIDFKWIPGGDYVAHRHAKRHH